MLLIWFLILFFLLLILSQIFLAHFYDFYESEGFTDASNNSDASNNTQFQSYSTNPPNNSALSLAQQNQNNIMYLNNRLSNISHLKNVVHDLSGNVTNLSSQVSQLMQAQQNAGVQVAPSSPPTISGTTD